MADRQLTAALAGAAASATAALNAPSIRTALAISDAQPWRWVVRPESMDLYADASRRLATLDPDRRLLMMSCGGSLHHARVALAAEGLGARVDLFPTPTRITWPSSPRLTGSRSPRRPRSSIRPPGSHTPNGDASPTLPRRHRPSPTSWPRPAAREWACSS